jgi:hypothetical protein
MLDLTSILKRQMHERLPKNRRATDKEFKLVVVNERMSRTELKKIKKEFYGPFVVIR